LDQPKTTRFGLDVASTMVKEKVNNMARKLVLVNKQGKSIQLPPGKKARMEWIEKAVSSAKLRPLGGGGHTMAFVDVYEKSALAQDGKFADPITSCSAREVEDAKQGLKERLYAFLGITPVPSHSVVHA
jgi:predicted ATP-grasp superfamily ATP-dependent carboligase